MSNMSNMSKTILIADDESRMRKLIRDFLRREGYEVIEAEDGLAALALLDSRPVDLAILDVMMPGCDGWTVCRSLRRKSPIPIIMLTAKGEEEDQLCGFDAGADEYITKPFSPKVLVARIQAMFRREEARAASPETGFVLDKASRTLRIDSETVELRPKEYELLLYLMENRGQALSREQILNYVWDYSYEGDLRTVDTHINRLRAKLGRYCDSVQTVRNFGYRFEVMQ